jgi:hypothetical protein
MKRIERMAKPLSIFLAVWVFMISGPHHAAMAALVPTDGVLDPSRITEARSAVRQLMAREDVQAALVRQGIDPAEAIARAEGLSDAEAVRLADSIAQLPAGGSAVGIVIGAVVIVFLVLLITDILGYTDVFPFVKKHR